MAGNTVRPSWRKASRRKPKSPELDYPPGLDKDNINAIGATSLITLVGFAMLQCQVPLSQTPSPRGVFARTDGGAPGGNPGEDLARLARLVCRLWLCAGPFIFKQCYVLARSAKQTNEHKSKPMNREWKRTTAKLGRKAWNKAKEGYYPIAKRSNNVLVLTENGVELGAFLFFASKQQIEAWETTC